MGLQDDTSILDTKPKDFTLMLNQEPGEEDFNASKGDLGKEIENIMSWANMPSSGLASAPVSARMHSEQLELDNSNLLVTQVTEENTGESLEERIKKKVA